MEDPTITTPPAMKVAWNAVAPLVAASESGVHAFVAVAEAHSIN